MLAKKRCPHTGIVNFFFDPEPFMAVGSIAKTGGSRACVWRCYIGEEAGGLSANMASAEARLASVILSAVDAPTGSLRRAAARPSRRRPCRA